MSGSMATKIRLSQGGRSAGSFCCLPSSSPELFSLISVNAHWLSQCESADQTWAEEGFLCVLNNLHLATHWSITTTSVTTIALVFNEAQRLRKDH